MKSADNNGKSKGGGPRAPSAIGEQRMLRHDLGNAANVIVGYVDLLRDESLGLPEAVLDAASRIDVVGHEIAAKVREIAVIRDDAVDSDGAVTRLRSKVDGVFGRQMTGLALRVLHLVGEAVVGLDDLAHPVSREDAAECLLAIENAARRVLQVLDQHHDPTTDLLARTLDPLHPGVGATVLPIRMARRARRPELVPSERRVLVVDDEKDNAELMARWLHRLGYQVATVESGHEALDMIRIANWDAIMLDIVMPGVDGIEVLRAIKTNPALRRIPVIMVSGHTDTARLATCLDAGADDFLNKPIDPAVLQARLRGNILRKLFADAERVRLRELRDEQERVDRFLHASFPAHTHESLRSFGHIAPRKHAEVSMVIANVLGFSRYCETHAPEVVVTYLDDLVRRFEAVAAEHGVEKIRTVGGRFIGAVGLDDRVPVPARAARDCAAAMVRAASESLAGWQIRVGIATGPVIAGVVGGSHCSYDLWGGTVEVAERVEGVAAPGEVWCCERTWRRTLHDRSESATFAGTVHGPGGERVKLFRSVPSAEAPVALPEREASGG